MVPLIDLMRMEALERDLPRTVSEDLAVLRRHLERVCQAAEVLVPFDELQRGGLCDLNAVLRDTVTLVAGRFEQCGIRVHMALEGELPLIPGNPVALRQVVMSLLDNARDTVTPGGVIWVETGRADSPAGVRLVVRDDGIGVPDEVRTFFEGSFQTTEVEKTWFGLSITRGIVEGHGGTIDLRSHAGAGTTWTILLPGTTGTRVGS
jgi:two-component system NtrC family sensor kinase